MEWNRTNIKERKIDIQSSREYLFFCSRFSSRFSVFSVYVVIETASSSNLSVCLSVCVYIALCREFIKKPDDRDIERKLSK